MDNLVLLRESLGRFLASEPDLEIAGECGTSAEALDILQRTPVDVTIIENRLLSECGPHFMLAARHGGYAGKVLVIADVPDLEDALGVLKLGASGIFPKDNPPHLLARAIRLVAGGNAWLDQRVVGILVQRVSQPRAGSFSVPLSERERRVLDGLCDGLTNRGIGVQLGISEGTVKATLRRLFRRVKAQNRSQLVRMALGGSGGLGG